MKRVLQWLPFALAVAIVLTTLGLRMWRVVERRRVASDAPKDASLILVTGYCNCGRCCGWQRSWFLFGEPVYAYGPKKGQTKKIGVTVMGTQAKRGTIAADPKVFPFGTHLVVPGYGPGTVEDIGGAIRGRHIDVWFPTHAEARAWGARWLKVRRVK